MIVWGKQDDVVPFENSDRVVELVRPTTFLPVDDAGHFPHYERSDVVGPALIRFLRG